MKYTSALLIVVIFGLAGCAANNDKNSQVLKTSQDEQKRELKLFHDRAQEQYHEMYRSATSSEDLKNFVAKYRDNDPDGLVLQASQRIPDLEAQEKIIAHDRYKHEFTSASSSSDFQAFIDNYQNNDPDNLIPQAKKKYKILAAKEERESAANEIRALSSIIEHDAILFRKDKDSLIFINSLVGLVKENDFTCDTVSAARPMLLTRGFVLTCNKFRYSYDIQDKGGHWQVTVN